MLPRVREFYGLERLWDNGENATVVERPGPKAVPDVSDNVDAPALKAPKPRSTRSGSRTTRRPAAKRPAARRPPPAN